MTNSSIATPQLRSVETQDDYARLTFDNNQGTGRFLDHRRTDARR